MDGTGNTQTKLQEALADPALPPVLKELAERIIPEKRLDDFRALVEAGAIEPAQIWAPQPLLSPVSQVFRTENPEEWLKVLFAQCPEKIADMKCPCLGYRNGNFTTDLNVLGSYYYKEVETPSLVGVLESRTQTPIVTLASLFPVLLSASPPDRYGNPGDQPVLHRMIATNREFSVDTLDRLEQITGGDAFLDIRNSRGETLFHAIAGDVRSSEDQTRLDMASWMLQRKPQLVNDPDRFGWTPLDRLVSRGQGKFDTSMGRLLVASGARLEKQLASPFNLKAAIAENAGTRLDKPALARPAVLKKGL